MPFGGVPKRHTILEDPSSRSGHRFFVRKPAFLTHDHTHHPSTPLQPISSEASAEADAAEPKPPPETPEEIENVSSNQSSISPAQGFKIEPLNNPLAEHRRFELFIDLVWTGIVANIAEDYSRSSFEPESQISPGRAFVSSIVLVLIAWRMWKFLQDFMSTYSTNDFVERIFVFWYLILAVIYGNNAPYFFAEGDEQSDTAIVVYLIAKASLLGLETTYAIFIPRLRKNVMIRWIVMLPLTAPWIASFFVGYPSNATLAFVGVMLEFAFTSLTSTPWFSRFFEHEKAHQHADHWVERIRDFYIIILGEGVVNFIRESPLGRGLNWKSGTGIAALAVWYFLINIYFNGDQARVYVHAVKRAWWRTNVWLFTHVIMFESSLLLSVAVRFIINNPSTNAVVPAEKPEEGSPEATGTGEPPPTRQRLLRPRSEHEELPVQQLMARAKWTMAIALAVVVTCMTVLAVLGRSLDRPGTFKIDNRYLRLGFRPVVVVVSLLLPLREHMNGSTALGISLALLYVTLMWEWWGSLDKKGKLVERHADTMQ